MGLAATLNRKRTVEKAAAASAAAVECIDAVNRQASQITRLHERTLALEQARTKVDERFDAQGQLVLEVEKQLLEKVQHAEHLEAVAHAGAADARVLQGRIDAAHNRLDAFAQMTWLQRLRWICVGLPRSAAEQAAYIDRIARIS